MVYKKLSIEVRERVGYILMHSGSRFNKLTVNTIRELIRAFSTLRDDPEAVCIVLTGHPGESFAVGADIGQMASFEPLQAFEFARLGQSLFSLMEDIGKPVIGALNGIAMGGGFDLAMACDIRLASDKLLMAHPGSKLGIITGFCGTQKLPRLAGPNRAREIFMTADSFDAAEALRMGVVNRVFAAGDFWPQVTAYAAKIAGGDPACLAWTKQLLNASEDVDLKNGVALETGAFATLLSAAKGRQSL